MSNVIKTQWLFLEVELTVTGQCPYVSMQVESLNIRHMLRPDSVKGKLL